MSNRLGNFVFLILFFLLYAEGCFAVAPDPKNVPVFTIAPVGILPTVLPTGESVKAIYRVTNNSVKTQTRMTVIKLPPGVSLTGGSCGPDGAISLDPGASCTIELTITIPVSNGHFYVCYSGGRACTGSTVDDDLNIQNAPITQPQPKLISMTLTPGDDFYLKYNAAENFMGTKQLAATAYYSDGTVKPIAAEWQSDAPLVATVDANGLITARGNGIAHISASLDSVSSARVTLTSVPAFAYITNLGNQSITACPVMAPGGQFGPCRQNAAKTEVPGLTMAISPDGRWLYYANKTTLGQCMIEDAGSIANCEVLPLAPAFNAIQNLIITNRYVYLLNKNDNGPAALFYCPVFPDSLGSCIQAMPSTHVSQASQYYLYDNTIPPDTKPSFDYVQPDVSLEITYWNTVVSGFSSVAVGPDSYYLYGIDGVQGVVKACKLTDATNSGAYVSQGQNAAFDSPYAIALG